MSSVLDTSIYLNGVRLPNYESFERDYEANQTVNVTEGGTLYVDFLNLRRSWICKWENMFRSDYDIIYGFYLWQYQNHSFPILQVPAFAINCPVLLDISSQKIKHNAVVISDFVLKITEQYPFS